MENVLIIGSKGFIGSNLMHHFAKKGLRTWGADVVVDYVNRENYFLIDSTNANFRSLFEGQHFDLCVNCSGAASVPDSLNDPLRDFQLNAANVFKILDAIRGLQPRCKFINLSSAAVYGNPVELPIRESASLSPVSPYGFHKLSSEQVCTEFHRFFDLQTCSLRIFSAFGDGLKKQLFWDLYHRARKEDPVLLFGTGEESRDFIYIGDLVRVIELVAKQTDFEGEAINVANGEEVLIKDAVASFYCHFDEPVNYKFRGEGRKGDPSNWIADISVIKSMGYKPRFSLKEGLEKYYQWLQQLG